jgi:hypothetical protein
MPVYNPLPNHLRRHREKVFGDGRPRPLDRNAKVRVMTLVRALMRRTPEKTSRRCRAAVLSCEGGIEVMRHGEIPFLPVIWRFVGSHRRETERRQGGA